VNSLAKVLAAAAVVAMTLGAPALSVSAAPTTARQATRTDALALVTQTPVVEPDADFTMRFHVNDPPAGATLRVELHARVPTRTDFQASLDGKVLRGVQGNVVVVPATPDASGQVTVSVATRDTQSTTPADPARPTFRLGEGVYPVRVVLADAKNAPVQQLVTYLVRLPVSHEFGPLGVTVVVPLSGRPALQPDGTVAPDQSIDADVHGITAALAAHNDVPVTIAATAETVDALDPAIVDAVRAVLPGRELSVTPYVRLHPGEWIGAGLTDDLARQFDRGGRDVEVALGQTDAPVYVADDRFTDDAARFVHDRGVTTAVVPDTALSPLDVRLFNRTLTQPFDLRDVEGVRAVAGDTALSRHVGSTGDPVLDANHLVADLAVLYFDDPPDRRAATVVLPDDRPLDARFVDALLAALSPSANRIVQPMTLSAQVNTVPPAGSRGETNGKGTPLVRALTPAPLDDLRSFATRLRAADDDLASYRTMVVGANNRPDDFERRALVAGADGLTSEQRNAYLDGMTRAVHDEVAKVQPPPKQTINFTARDGVVSLTLKVSTGYPVAVDVVLQGEKLEFPGHEDGHVPLTLTDETTRVPINVRTRASGDSPLNITVQSPDGRLVVGRTRMTVRSTAFSGVGVVLSLGAGGFLAIWWARHIITTRRSRRRRPRHAVGG